MTGMGHRTAGGGTAFSAALLLFLALLPLPSNARRGNIMRKGFNNQFDHNYETMQGSPSETFTPLEKNLLSRQWALSPLRTEDLMEKLNDDKLVHHIQSIMGKSPVLVRLKERQIKSKSGAEVFRADATVEKTGRPLRAKWRRSTVNERLDQRSLLGGSYEDNIAKLYVDSVEVELILPPVEKPKSGRPVLPCVVYSFVTGAGNINPMAVVTKASSRVRVYPRGRKELLGGEDGDKRRNDGGIDVSLGSFHVPMAPGLVDPSWAKGRKMFWKGRPVGQM